MPQMRMEAGRAEVFGICHRRRPKQVSRRRVRPLRWRLTALIGEQAASFGGVLICHVGPGLAPAWAVPPWREAALLSLIRVVKTTSRWKSRKACPERSEGAGERALRYMFFCAPPHAPLRVNDCQFALGFESAYLSA